MSIKRPKEGWNVRRLRTHPGEILREEFMKPLGLSANRLALALHVPVTRVSEIIHEHRSVSADTALRLARYFETDAEYWLRFQMAYDLSKAQLELKDLINRQVPVAKG